MKVLICLLLVMAISYSQNVENIERAHRKTEVQQQQAVEFNLKLVFGGEESMDAKFTILTNSTMSLIEFADGHKIVTHGSKSYHTQNYSKANRARFDAYTWQYFFLFPYKMNDQGTRLSSYDTKQLNNKTYETHKLTFEAGTGDAPNDRYLIYANPENHLIEALGYIVSLGKTQAEALKRPRAIRYKNFTDVDGIPVATLWEFWSWAEGDRLVKKSGEGTLSNIRFTSVSETIFDLNELFVEVK